jgi:hypothetical protein
MNPRRGNNSPAWNSTFATLVLPCVSHATKQCAGVAACREKDTHLNISQQMRAHAIERAGTHPSGNLSRGRWVGRAFG